MGRLRAVADTGPLVAAVNARERSHRVARHLVASFGRSLLVPMPVIAETDHMLRSRIGLGPARSFLSALAEGAHEIGPLPKGLFRRAVEIDRQYADLDLGLADASVMATAEHHRLPILTFDFADFRAAPGREGPWPLVISEEQLVRALGSGA